MPNDVLTAAIDALARREDLSADRAGTVLAQIMDGAASEAQIAAFLIALRTKGETEDEIAGLAATMRAFATPVRTARTDLVDTAGTGGGRQTFNVSTTAALIAAGAGCALAKHGNRSATGLSGSADVLEALGARIDLDPAAVGTCIDELGFGFMFAPAHHAATRFVVPVRRELAVRTIFNFLGPLTNPAGARRQLIGVSDAGFLDVIAGALARLGCDRALVVSSEDGLDELSTSGPTQVVEVNDEQITRYVVHPADVGVAEAPYEQVRGGTPAENAATARSILAGEPGPKAELAVLNAGAAIYAGAVAGSLREGVEAARAAIASGGALASLDRYVARSVEDARMSTILDQIVDATREEVRRRRERVPLRELEAHLVGRGDDRPFSEALTQPGVSIIAEHKRRSPSAGDIRAGAKVREIVCAYERGGAAALSILTEGAHFGGELDDLREARTVTGLPLLRKDFIVDRYQVVESAVAGADAILLIVAALGDEELRHLFGDAAALDLDVLVEVHDEAELDRALEQVDADVIGINNRDLGDFSVDVERTYDLLADVPAGKTVVSESGYHSRDQLEDLERIGVDAVLVGESLMRAADPEAATRELSGAPPPGEELAV